MNTVIQWFVIGYFMMVGIKVARKVNVITQCFIRTLHKYGFDKDLKSHLRGQGVSETKLETFTRLLMPTEDQGGGAEGCF